MNELIEKKMFRAESLTWEEQVEVYEDYKRCRDALLYINNNAEPISRNAQEIVSAALSGGDW